MPLSRLVIERARDDDPDRHPLVLSESEQDGLRDDVGECAELARALNQGRAVGVGELDGGVNPIRWTVEGCRHRH